MIGICIGIDKIVTKYRYCMEFKKFGITHPSWSVNTSKQVAFQTTMSSLYSETC